MPSIDGHEYCQCKSPLVLRNYCWLMNFQSRLIRYGRRYVIMMISDDGVLDMGGDSG